MDMAVQPESLPGINITLLYDMLPLERLDRNRLRGIFKDPLLTVMDTPELVVMFAPTRSLVAQFGDKRVRLTDQGQHLVEQTNLAELAAQVDKAIQGSKLAAYGFNFETALALNDDQTPASMLKARFLPDEEQIALLVGGQIEIMAPRLVFWRGATRYDLFFEPDPKQLKAHVNVHFETDTLPGAKALQESMRAEHELFATTLVGLFSGIRP
jgi:hypothetical protein